MNKYLEKIAEQEERMSPLAGLGILGAAGLAGGAAGRAAAHVAGKMEPKRSYTELKDMVLGKYDKDIMGRPNRHLDIYRISESKKFMTEGTEENNYLRDHEPKLYADPDYLSKAYRSDRRDAAGARVKAVHDVRKELYNQEGRDKAALVGAGVGVATASPYVYSATRKKD